MPTRSSAPRPRLENDLRQNIERVLEYVRDYPRGPRTRERLHRTTRALNELVTALDATESLARRSYLQAARNGAVVTNPAVELWVVGKYEGEVVDRIGVLYHFAADGETARFGIAYYAPDDVEEGAVGDVDPGEARWRERLRAPLETLAGAGFQTDEGGRDQRIAAAERWGDGWLAWRSYDRRALPDLLALTRDLEAALAAYDLILEGEGTPG